ncbi:hypothetical protein A0128_16335 [Leptospira tipperaryensis]|uniref:Alpha/beta hydrolase n=1 Tax=Leptospira tipperaryensis TaxID=2564040 RepID=A0A1D7V0B1_9LEPT|nr:hypothetical protein [Leptospira tipperaryensis]AOP35272.1 hypothetical protein A0128_16335 [Leptospira tipperaryensis]
MQNVAIIGILILFSLFCQQTQKFYRGQGMLVGKERELAVDSDAAVKLLQSSEAELRIPSLKELSSLVKRYSSDYATIFFLRAIYSNPFQKRSQKLYLNFAERLKTSGLSKRDLVRLDKFQFLFVPGLAYRLDTSTGADFSRQREWFGKRGIKTVLIETDEFGLAKNNALIIGKYLATHSDKRKIILVSASKGSQDVLAYLNEIASPEETARIHSWVNIGGINRGTLLADEFTKFPKSLLAKILLGFRGRSTELVKDLQRKQGPIESGKYFFPDTIKVIHFQGVLLESQVNDRIRSRYKILKPFGPNDGLTLTIDSIIPDGIVITEIGLDHYFQDPEIDIKTAALALLAADNETIYNNLRILNN